MLNRGDFPSVQYKNKKEDSFYEEKINRNTQLHGSGGVRTGRLQQLQTG